MDEGGAYMRESILLDEKIMEKAMNISPLMSKKEVIESALLDYIAAQSRKDLFELQGKIIFSDGYDYKKLREGVLNDIG
jgi:Arc/MetJ family transcription regulator